MRFKTLCVVSIAAFLFAVPFSNAQEQQIPTSDQVIRVTVEMVQVDAQVLQKKTGRPVGLLNKEDFRLFEDGVQQSVAEMSRDQLPLSVVLLFDLTDSVRPVLKPLAAGALDALKHLKPEDEVAVMVYAAKTELLQDFTTNRGQVVAAIRRAGDMESSEAAFFNEAVFQASNLLSKAKNPRSRRTIIWLTDNVPNIPNDGVHSESDAFHEVFETGTVVSALLERSAFSDVAMVAFSRNPIFAPSRKHHPPGDVYKYAERTGGDVMKSGKDEVSAKLARLIDEIRTRYTLGYYPSSKQPKGKFCEIKIQMTKEAEKREGQMKVRTKKGYYR
ncbi:MAG TPA: VWA domain-containing protein [Candidatus Angelobacter sp.]|nr:VWA domain-containing protein [Candidatus Angelobacter sp.]